MSTVHISKIAHFRGHTDSVYALSLSKHGGFYSSGADGMVVYWPSIYEQDGILLFRTPVSVYCLFESSSFIIAGARDGNLYIGKIPKKGSACEDVRIVPLGNGAIFDIQYHQESYWIGCESGNVLQLGKDFESMGTILISAKSIRCLLIREQNLLAGSSDGKIYKIECSTQTPAVFGERHLLSVFALCDLETNGFISAGRDAIMVKWDMMGNAETPVQAHNLTIHSLATNGHGLLASASMDKQIRIWKVPTLELLKVIDFERYEAHRNCINKVLWIDPNHVISCADDRTIMVFQISGISNS